MVVLSCWVVDFISTSTSLLKAFSGKSSLCPSFLGKLNLLCLKISCFTGEGDVTKMAGSPLVVDFSCLVVDFSSTVTSLLKAFED